MDRFRPPALRAGVRDRARVDALLQGATAGFLRTLVSAPAGYGKSTAVASWLRSSRRTARYVTFGEEGTAAAELRTLLAEAIGGVGDDGREEPRIVVLDDLHLVTDPDALAEIRRAVERTEARVRWVLITRVDPPLPLSRWRLAEELAEVGPTDLAFTLDEADALLRGMGVPLDPETLALLVARTEGWGAGLQLAALSLRGRSGVGVRDFVERFTGRDKLVLAYLTEEVLQRLDPKLHDFLMLLSALGEVTPEIAARATGHANAPELLAELERRNHFVLPGRQGGGFVRLHPFFRDLLRARLDDVRPGLAEELLARARASAAPDPPTTATEAGAIALTERERAVLNALAAGAGNKAIARALGVSPNTVKTHLARLYEKLQVRNRTEAVVRAQESGLVVRAGDG